jgi:uncharacterized protein YkwD
MRGYRPLRQPETAQLDVPPAGGPFSLDGMAGKVFAVACAFVVGACSTAPRYAPPPIDREVVLLKERLFVLVEEERHRLNAEARPLALDPELSAAAQAHSDEMAKKRSFDTMNPDGNLAVNTLLHDPKFRGFVGEISAAQYFTPAAGFDPEAYARGFLAIWLNSPDHKNNLSYANFDRTGIGVAVNGNAIYAAEVFATDLGLPEPE